MRRATADASSSCFAACLLSSLRTSRSAGSDAPDAAAATPIAAGAPTGAAETKAALLASIEKAASTIDRFRPARKLSTDLAWRMKARRAARAKADGDAADTPGDLWEELGDLVKVMAINCEDFQKVERSGAHVLAEARVVDDHILWRP